MNIRPDDPRITAYHLGELSSEEARQIERAGASDPAVGMALREAGVMTGFLKDTLGPEGAVELRPAQREAVLRAGREETSGKIVELRSAKRSRLPWLTGLGAAAVVAFTAVLMSRLGDGPGRVEGPTAREVALLPQPGPTPGRGVTGAAAGGAHATTGGGGASTASGDFLESVARELSQGPLPEATELPATTNQSSFSNSAVLRLPVAVGTASPTWVRRWIEEKGELPPAGAVRVEEMVNSVTLPTDREVGGLKLGLYRLDWGGSRWIGVQLATGDEAVDDLKVLSESRSNRRVVGSFGTRDDDALEVGLSAGRSTLILVEFDDETADPGQLTVLMGSAMQSFELAEACTMGNPGMHHAVATAVFGRWLRAEADEDQLRQALALAGRGEVDPIHREDHRLMRRALELSVSDD
ncbi:von Willebrand factor type A domain-containing protein [Haloferula sp. A504]|uniref:VWA domain-containing protein n=1 Tax=Haloferula sp. A504 TaxID=3373601 RepID=UPI0031BC8BDB|nr:von Willebrand factor type A domain-containing protein [Verrucomicrobiaceae bacterium E54]